MPQDYTMKVGWLYFSFILFTRFLFAWLIQPKKSHLDRVAYNDGICMYTYMMHIKMQWLKYRTYSYKTCDTENRCIIYRRTASTHINAFQNNIWKTKTKLFSFLYIKKYNKNYRIACYSNMKYHKYYLHCNLLVEL